MGLCKTRGTPFHGGLLVGFPLSQADKGLLRGQMGMDPRLEHRGVVEAQNALGDL